MHARHRNGPGNGYRSNAMGISPEGSVRSPRMFNSEYRNYNRGGYGRGGHSKQFQPPLPPPRETDIFVEAGKLAAEYLMSKGMLPPNALSGKWQNDRLKNQVGNNFPGFRPREVENTQVLADAHVTAHSRSGNAALDVGPVRRRYSDEYNSMGSMNSTRERTRTSLKNNGSEANKECGNSESWAEKSDEQAVGKDGIGEMQIPSPGEITQEVNDEAHVESGLDKPKLVENADAEASYAPPNADADPTKKCDEVVEEGRNDNDLEEQHEESMEFMPSVREDSLASEEDRADLVKDCKFVNVPTKIRSSLTNNGSKGDEDPINNDDGNISKVEELSEGSGTHVIDVDVDNSAGNALSNQNLEPIIVQSDVLSVPAVEKEFDAAATTRPGQCLRSRSFPVRFGYKEQEPDDDGLLEFGRSNSMFIERGGKRAMDDDDTCGGEGFKKLREWAPTLSSSMENIKPMLRNSQSAQETPGQKSLDISLFPKVHHAGFMEEKQLFPGSSKTWDLNLIGNSDVNENRDVDPTMHIFPSVTQTGKVATPIDVDLSISNNNLPNRNGKHGDVIEIIDLENDSAQEDKTFNDPERRGDAVFTDLDGFPNNVHSANEIPEVHDGYGLMISELLGHDSPNCSSVPTDLNSLHNHMRLPSEEEILGDDDSIYMSLGEIPISLLGPWEQPPQNYGKPF